MQSQLSYMQVFIPQGLPLHYHDDYCHMQDCSYRYIFFLNRGGTGTLQVAECPGFQPPQHVLSYYYYH